MREMWYRTKNSGEGQEYGIQTQAPASLTRLRQMTVGRIQLGKSVDGLVGVQCGLVGGGKPPGAAAVSHSCAEIG